MIIWVWRRCLASNCRFTVSHLNRTLQVTETQFADNILDRGLVLLTYIQTVGLTANKFQSTFVFNGVNYSVVLADIGYDGSCDYVLALYLNSIFQTYPTLMFLHPYQFNSAYPTLYFKYSLLTHWNTLSNVDTCEPCTFIEHMLQSPIHPRKIMKQSTSH